MSHYTTAWKDAFKALTQRVTKAVTSVPSSAIDAAAANALGSKQIGLAGPAILSNQPPLTLNGKPELLYIGSEGCPYCAMQRWGLIVALSRFGKFSNLHLMQSLTTERPEVRTFTFFGSHYSSPYVSFVPVEAFSNIPSSNGFAQLQPLSAAQGDLFATYDQEGTFPFVDVANAYTSWYSTVLPEKLAGMNWTQILGSLSHPDSAAAQAVAGEAEVLTAELCSVTGGRPQSVCAAPLVAQYLQGLPSMDGKGGGCPANPAVARRTRRRPSRAQLAATHRDCDPLSRACGLLKLRRRSARRRQVLRSVRDAAACALRGVRDGCRPGRPAVLSGVRLPASRRRPAGGTAVPAPAVPAASVERRQVSVLFADLTGFTSFSERRDAEDVREMLSEYFDSSRRIIDSYGGRVEKFIGDAVMALWGAPVAHEDDAERAVRAGLDLVAAVTALGDKMGVQLRLRVGILTGQAAVELDAVAEGMVIGDAINTASRIQSVAEPGSVLVDDVTRAVTERAIAYEDGGEHSVKGKTEPVHTWRALRVIAALGGVGRTDMELPLVGRDAEMAVLRGAVDALIESHAGLQLVSVIGEPGLGKSRLAWELKKYADGLAATLLWHHGQALSFGQGAGFASLAEMVRARADISPDDPAASHQLKLQALVDDLLASAEPDVRGRVLRATEPTARTRRRPGADRSRRAVLLVAAAVRAPGHARPGRDAVRGSAVGRPGAVRLHRAPVRVGSAFTDPGARLQPPGRATGRRLAPGEAGRPDAAQRGRHRVADRGRGRGRPRGAAEQRARERGGCPAVRGRIASHARRARSDEARRGRESVPAGQPGPRPRGAAEHPRADRRTAGSARRARAQRTARRRRPRSALHARRRGGGGRRRDGRRPLAARWARLQAVSVRRHRSAIAVAGDVHVRAPPGGARGARHALKARAQGPSPGGRRVPLRARLRSGSPGDPGGASRVRLRGASDRARRTRHQAPGACASRSMPRSARRASER